MTGMKLASSLPIIVPPRFLLVAMGFPTLAIFVFDAAPSVGFAVAATYVLVVLMAQSFDRRNEVLLVSASCMLLTILSYFLIHGTAYAPTPPVRAITSLATIAIATLLALSICRSIVKAYESRTWVSSDSCTGGSFHLALSWNARMRHES
jgi:hypothetical protein